MGFHEIFDLTASCCCIFINIQVYHMYIYIYVLFSIFGMPLAVIQSGVPLLVTPPINDFYRIHTRFTYY